MDGDWEEVGRLLLPPPGPQAIPTPIVSFALDPSQELLWIGNEFGRVSSFYGTEIQHYASFRAGPGPVRQLLFHDKGIIALGPNFVHMALRRGPPIWHLGNEDMKDLRCMSYTSKGTSEILVAGWQDQMFLINVDKGTVTRQIQTVDHYTFMKRSRYICAATQTGTVNILDSGKFSVVKTWNAHPAGISDMDAQHDFIVTCGYSLRQQQNYMLDPLVNVFDLKNMVSLPPIPFPAGAAYVRLHPRMSTTSIVVSQYGQIHIVDLMNVNTSNVKQANVLSHLTMIEIASSGEAMILADAECNVHLWGSPSRVRFGELGSSTEFADPVETTPHINWTNDNPLNTIGMPYYREQLLSAWPSHMIFEVGAPPAKIDPRILATLKTMEFGGVGPNPRTVKRNQVENTRTVEKSTPSLKAPKFLSEKARDGSSDADIERSLHDVTDVNGAELLNLKANVPVIYRNVEIKYSKFGIDDFDFGFFNKTPYSGLEIHISNSYANPLLQLMHFTPTLRNIALQHAASSCVAEFCLLCEMGYLFDMLEKAEGSTCQATNLLKTLSNFPQAAQLGLLEEDTHGVPLTTMLQGLMRFLAEKIAAEWRSIPPHISMVEKALATTATTNFRCMNCRSEHTRPGTTSVIEMRYPPPKLAVRNVRPPKTTFSQVLKRSIEREEVGRGWCSRCQRYQSLSQRGHIHNVPPVFVLTAAVNSPEARAFWATSGCLPEEIGIIIDHQGQFFCYEGEDLKLHLQRGMHNITVYSLIGLVTEIDSGQNQKPHLVSLINIAHSQPEPPGESQWHLFNDFLVEPVRTEEALSFNPTWKLPSVIVYQSKASNNRIDVTWKQRLDASLLYTDHNTNPGERTYHPLVPSIETPREGVIVALDTEFVMIKQSEIAANAEGVQETIRPTLYALARVSVIRGSGEEELEPFIDDYVNIKEPIVNYLTEYSGIMPEDLNPRFSKHNLVSLKIAYKKLWILLNLGCKFLGHGLKQDFRVVNIHVPKAQVIDTSDLFYLEHNRMRKLSLAFLARILLSEEIQQVTHDSIEDAKTALKLYRKYLEYQDAGVLEAMRQEIYARGKDTNWKMPKKDGLEVMRTETPPIVHDGAGAMVVPVFNGPTTPVKRPLGLPPVTGSSGGTTFGSGWTPGKGGSAFGGSPLR